jgi:hypothetical protein
VNDEHQFDRAKALMDDYQENRFREKHAEMRDFAAPDGTGPSCRTRWKNRYR